MLDRRQRRSEKREEALSLFLEAERKRLGVRGLALGTEQGQLIAGAGIGLKRLAAIGASIHTHATSSVLSPSLATWGLRIHDHQFIVTCLGRKFTANLGEGIRRILLACD
ncbi:MAG TPA: hypothetical protein PKL73_04265 [Polyangiaceae bacterium]|nr:MAG: hypothetical protein BWY17_00277 [Deltaproteobacteria bacterium ADurb.Bin207]HNS96144.1 hypothetical protein [Polyangiaceae bacterium]HNZ22230.1 hypothetical protein [Polyangiaceae bacterium]HOD22254.1 hypothetical protein [Polyangiaceae bacterium]HOE47054.1 hypothetical protein [Polyangiaceae bacterium]